MSIATPEVRATRLLQWYPAAWRERYGEEFAELLIAEIEEQPASFRRTADIAVNGIAARLTMTGLRRGAVTEPATALATISCLLVGFVAMGVSLWSQLIAGTSTAGGHDPAAAVGLPVVTIALCYLALLMVLAATPILISAARRCRERRVAGPLVAMAISISALVLGGHHLAQHRNLPPFHGLIPRGLAQFAWAETVSINTCWAHPGSLNQIPAARLGWMVASPIALITALVAATMLLRRLELSAGVVRFETRIARAAAFGMLSLLAGAAYWVLQTQQAANSVARSGTLDLAMIFAMAVVTVLAVTTSLRAARA